MKPRSTESSTGEQEHRSPGLSLITTHLRNEHKQNVLDLGAATTANIEFLSELQCKVYVEHLASTLDEINASGEASATTAANEQLLPFSPGLHFDVVLAWDLLNYLESHALDALITRLTPFCKRETLLFALIFTGRQMPAAPLVFKISGEDRLRYELNSARMRPGPQYTTPTLLKKLPGFSVVRAYLLQNNIQEYVLKFSR
jgi:trans-aconitate methyltransferase